MIVVRCPCGEVYKADDDKAGYSLICSKCRRVVDLDSSGHKPTTVLRPRRNPSGVIIGALTLIVACLISYNLYTAPLGTGQKVAAKQSTVNLNSGGANPEPKITAVPGHPNKPVAKAVPYLPPEKEVAENARRYRTVPTPSPTFVPAPLPMFVPAPPAEGEPSAPHTVVSPLSGTDITAPVDAAGRCTLTIENGNAEDAVVKLVNMSDGSSPQVSYRCIYVRAGDSSTVQNISAGRYSLLYRSGSDWNGQGGFNTHELDHKFVKVLGFEDTTSTSDSGDTKTEWSALTVTLHPVLTGNIRSQPMAKEDFDGIK